MITYVSRPCWNPLFSFKLFSFGVWYFTQKKSFSGGDGATHLAVQTYFYLAAHTQTNTGVLFHSPCISYTSNHYWCCCWLSVEQRPWFIEICCCLPKKTTNTSNKPNNNLAPDWNFVIFEQQLFFFIRHSHIFQFIQEFCQRRSWRWWRKNTTTAINICFSTAINNIWWILVILLQQLMCFRNWCRHICCFACYWYDFRGPDAPNGAHTPIPLYSNLKLSLWMVY